MALVLEAGRVTTPARLSRSSITGQLVRGMGFAFVLGLVALLVAPVVAMAFGFRAYVVTSGSMEPTAKAGDTMLLHDVQPESLEPGDIITFRPLRGGGVTTHRIVSTHDVEGVGLHFRTKGDNNPDFDPNLVPAANVIGEVAGVMPKVGRVLLFATTRLGRLVFVGVPALIVIARELYFLFVPPRPSNVVVVAKRRRRDGHFIARAGTLVLLVMMASSVMGPAAAVFGDSRSIGGNALSSGTLNAPTITSATASLIPCQVTVHWSAPSTGVAPDGYDLYRATNANGPFSFRKHVGAVTSTVDDTGGLGLLTTYHYTMRSTRGSWTSGNSNVRSVTTLLCVG